MEQISVFENQHLWWNCNDRVTYNYEYLNLTLQLIEGNSLPFGGVSIIASGYFLQLPPVMVKAEFQPPKTLFIIPEEEIDVSNCLKYMS